MFDPMTQVMAKQGGRLDAEEKALLDCFRRLMPEQRQSLLDFASFLASRAQAAEEPADEAPAEPLAIERPAQETVVAAMKRLSATYPMIDKALLLNDASALMAQHLLQGRAAAEVIDDLERLFLTHFENFRQGKT